MLLLKAKNKDYYLDQQYRSDRVAYAELVSGFKDENERPCLYEWQKRMLRSRHKRKILNCARQAGKSSLVAVIPTWTARFVPGSASFVLAAVERQAIYVMNKIKACIKRDTHYPRLLRASDSLIEVENGSSIEVLCATDKSARGPTRPRVIIPDEASRIEDEVISKGIVPMLNNIPNCELIVPSTPNGRSGFFFRAFNNQRWERY